MKNKLFLAVGLVVLLVLASLAGCAATGVGAADVQPVNVNVNSQQTGIWVNGEGKVTVTPDVALVYLGVSAKADKVADAQAQAASAMDKIIAALVSNGVDKKDIKTQYFSIQQYMTPVPEARALPPYSASDLPTPVATPITQITGYEVSNTVSVKIREVEKTGAIIDAVAAAGGDNTRINGISFSVDKPEQYYAQAGVTLGKVTYISENTYSPGPYPIYSKAYDMAVAAPATSISPGQTDIILNVQVNYSIQ
jgi:uncharacterized protein YggE